MSEFGPIAATLEDCSMTGQIDGGTTLGTILVTGAGGFIGQRLSHELEMSGHSVVRMLRSSPPLVSSDSATIRADLLDPNSLVAACRGVKTIIHCAGHAHAIRQPNCLAGTTHHEINVIGTRNLIEASIRADVERLVFLSSVKAVGAPGEHCVDENWPLPPDTPYGQSKREAEAVVMAAGKRHGMGVTNLRLAMVYGSGGRGNLERMARGVAGGWFPPLPETGNRRSLIHVHDVVSAIRCVLGDPRSIGRTYIVAHPRTLSGAEIYDALRTASARGEPRWRVPAALLNSAGRLGDSLRKFTGRALPLNREVVYRLLGSECYCADAIRQELGWEASISFAEGVRELFDPSDGVTPWE